VTRVPRTRGKPATPARGGQSGLATAPPGVPDVSALRAALHRWTRECIRPPRWRFQHPWLAPMPLSAAAARLLSGASGPGQRAAGSGDGFSSGDYSLGLFHHDASEASIVLLAEPEFREAAAGSLLCLLDCADPSGRVHRAELPHKAREAEPAKPVIAQYALRCTRALGAEWAERHRVYPRAVAFQRWQEQHLVGLHGLFLTWNSLQSGFDTDVLSAGFPDRTIEGPDTNAFAVLEYEALAELARLLGRPGEADAFLESAAGLRQRIEDLLWDEGLGHYIALRWEHGVGAPDAEVVGTRDVDAVVRPFVSWTGLLPLYAGIPSPARARRIVEVLLRPEGFWGPMGVRTCPADDLYFQQSPRVLLFDFKKGRRGPVSNWSGPVWVLSSAYLAEGLARYGFTAEARELALRTARLLANDLARTGVLHECWNDAGEGLWPRSGTFVSWNVLGPWLLDRHAPDVRRPGAPSTEHPGLS
jgi:Mannosylglycerate hydrolase MGH1-like glycoside hydrolase domain